MLHLRPHLGAAVMAVALLAAGCGSSDDGGAGAGAAKPAAAATTKAAAPAVTTPTTTTPAAAATGPKPTQAAYIRRADRICLLARGVSRRANEVVSKAFAAGQAARAADAITSYMPLFTQHLQQLKDLPRPAGDQQILDGLIKVMDGQVQALADESTALRAQDTASMQQITKAQQQEVQFAEDLGRQYGFKVCGRSSVAAATAGSS
jgi:hypothetical protein